MIILVLRPFNIGDYIEAQGEQGTVQRIDIFSTVLTRLDNQRVIIPNGPLAGGNINNKTAEKQRMVDLAIGVGYGDDLHKAISALTEMCNTHPKVLKTPGAMVGIHDYGDSSINLVVRPWVLTEDYWTVFFELNLKIKQTLDDAGISIPFPQRDVHLHNSSPS